jgi:S-adenosylmethionine:tRNA ribosyltransferase-isomerase
VPDHTLDDFDALIDPSLVAQQPCEPRDAARLLVVDRAGGSLVHAGVGDLPTVLRPGDCLVVNATRVLSVRLQAVRATGGQVRLLLIPPAAVGRAAGGWECYAEAGGKLQPGEVLELPDGTPLTLAERRGGGRWRVEADVAALERCCADHGRAPLPPYIKRPAADDPQAADDRARYQTMFARAPGAVAAPTAGLHFTPALLGRTARAGIGAADLLLHVGPGTFAPPRAPGVGGPEPERCEVSADTVELLRETRAAGGRIVAVGTTVTRALEWAAAPTGELAPRSGAADIVLGPGHEFKAIDALMTNFHQPGSGPLKLTAGFAGIDRLYDAYAEAVRARYRFWSYGDAMLIV